MIPSSLATVCYLGAAILFILSLGGLSHPESSRRGNLYGMIGMALAVLATIFGPRVTGSGLPWIIGAMAVGGTVGLYAARKVQMTQMPELVALMHSLVGLAAVLVGYANYIDPAASFGLTSAEKSIHEIEIYIGILIGAVTFSGSLIASGKLQGVIRGKPIIFPGSRLLTIAMGLVALFGTFGLVFTATGTVVLDPLVADLVLLAIIGSALVFGVTMVLPIGGADMPVVISLLNAFTGTAAAMAGFAIDNPVLIIAGALVGASGGILTKLMADAMNRSILNIMIGGFGGGESAVAATGGGAGGSVRAIGADDAAIQLAYASTRAWVP